jgi:hypothetical protein
MMGSHNDEGITPRLCRSLFKRAEEHRGGVDSVMYSYKVEVSYLEIYMERVRDLLNPNNTNLRVREHSVYGPFCENLTSVAVSNYVSLRLYFSLIFIFCP